MSTLNRRMLLACAALGMTGAIPRRAASQGTYPERPIRLIVPFAPGGVGDVVARLWTDQATPLLGTLVIENRGGASGMIGAGEVARAAPDGHTLLLGNTSTQVLNPLIAANATYAGNDFAAVSILAGSPLTLAVHPSVPAKNFNELVTYVKTNRGKVSYGSPALAPVTQLAGELFKRVVDAPDIIASRIRAAHQPRPIWSAGHFQAIRSDHEQRIVAASGRADQDHYRIQREAILWLPDVEPAATYDAPLVLGIFKASFARRQRQRL